MAIVFHPFRTGRLHDILTITAQGECCAVYGLSNTGKSLLLRALAGDASLWAEYTYAGWRTALPVYIDCNRVVELSAPGFYEIVVRAILETLEDASPTTSPGLLQFLREQHNLITAAPVVFRSSLAFNQAISECCRQLERNLIFLLDEFDEIYGALEDRSLLNLRALRDKFAERLVYVAATVRPLAECRSPGDNEFAELFAPHTVPLGLLDIADAERVVEALSTKPLSSAVRQKVELLAGGHLGLLTALIHAAERLPEGDNGGEQLERLSNDPHARAECLKIWNQLRSEEQAALKSLVSEPNGGLNPHDRSKLESLGLLTGANQIFSELFAAFVRRQCSAPVSNAVGVVVDEDAGEVWVDGDKITVLTDLEYRLMRLLYQRRDRLTTKDMIVEAVWGTQYFDRVDDARIEKLVSRLRAKVESDPAHPRYLQTQRGRGYRLSSQPLDSRALDEETD